MTQRSQAGRNVARRLDAIGTERTEQAQRRLGFGAKNIGHAVESGCQRRGDVAEGGRCRGYRPHAVQGDLDPHRRSGGDEPAQHSTVGGRQFPRSAVAGHRSGQCRRVGSSLRPRHHVRPSSQMRHHHRSHGHRCQRQCQEGQRLPPVTEP